MQFIMAMYCAEKSVLAVMASTRGSEGASRLDTIRLLMHEAMANADDSFEQLAASATSFLRRRMRRVSAGALRGGAARASATVLPRHAGPAHRPVNARGERGEGGVQLLIERVHLQLPLLPDARAGQHSKRHVCERHEQPGVAAGHLFLHRSRGR
mgnify:CR=1 FL=1|jgi:hypothetical protein